MRVLTVLTEYRISRFQIPKASILEQIGLYLSRFNNKERENELADQIGDVVEKIKRRETNKEDVDKLEELYGELEKLLNEYMQLRLSDKQEITEVKSL